MTKKLEDSNRYARFGTAIYMLRKSRKISTEEMAAVIQKSVAEYRKEGLKEEDIKKQVEKDIEEYKQIELGQRLPNDDELQKICNRLGITLAAGKDLRLQAKRKIGEEEAREITGALTLSPDLENTWEQIQEIYKKETGQDLTYTQRRLFALLKKKLYRVFLPPSLPFDTVIILSTIKRHEQNTRYLSEIVDFLCEGESFSGYLARHFWGAYLWYMANLFLFPDDPSPSILTRHSRNQTGWTF